jgi:hypothetical protein
LGGLPDVAVRDIAQQICRVLKPGGLLFLTENTALKPDLNHWFYRTAAQYIAFFPTVKLTVKSTFLDAEEEISVMAGRASK